MECKSAIKTLPWKNIPIRIVPEWNVNKAELRNDSICDIIRIVPEWNVNVKNWVLVGSTGAIRIVPEWNVNSASFELIYMHS